MLGLVAATSVTDIENQEDEPMGFKRTFATTALLICIGAGLNLTAHAYSESGGIFGTGAESDSGGNIGNGSSTESGGLYGSGSSSQSGGAWDSFSDSESGGFMNSGSHSESGGVWNSGAERESGSLWHADPAPASTAKPVYVHNY